MQPFHLNYIDHVAIRVKDMEVTLAWYEKVLGLKPCRLEKWGAYPVFLLAGKMGVAVFPADASIPVYPPDSKHIKLDHFAFNVSQADFEKAQQYFDHIGQPYIWKDHYYFQSVYLQDPDDHTVELTTLTVNEEEVYHSTN
jgi:catechol 2,3-dioxygenase-like lactoylglutathione lyase family enzyme